MYPIALINMPFAGIDRPSIALTQLKAVLNTSLPGRVDPKIFYLNHDIAEFLGLEVYNAVSNSFTAIVSGLGDWFFAGVGFPEAPDQTRPYLSRHPRPRTGKHRDPTAAAWLVVRGGRSPHEPGRRDHSCRPARPAGRRHGLTPDDGV